jgi:hypothetical protein
MDSATVGSVGGLLIGLIAGAVGTWRSIVHARPGAERRRVGSWAAIFTLALAAFFAGVPLVPDHRLWLFGLPLLGMIVLAVTALNRQTANPEENLG